MMADVVFSKHKQGLPAALQWQYVVSVGITVACLDLISQTLEKKVSLDVTRKPCPLGTFNHTKVYWLYLEERGLRRPAAVIL